MNNSLERIIDGLTKALTDEIIPHIEDAFARGQAIGIVDLLRNLKPRLEWSHALLWEQVDAQETTLRRVEALSADEIVHPPAIPRRRFDSGRASAKDLEAWRDELEAEICRLLKWIEQEHHRLSAQTALEIEKTLVRYMREQLDRDIEKTANPLFAEISRGAKAPNA